MFVTHCVHLCFYLDSEGKQQSVKTLRVSNVEKPADAVIPEVLTPLPAPPLPDRLFKAVGQQISNPQTVHDLQSSWRQVGSSTPVPCQTLTNLQLKESCKYLSKK
jgi:hypothetical protein